MFDLVADVFEAFLGRHVGVDVLFAAVGFLLLVLHLELPSLEDLLRVDAGQNNHKFPDLSLDEPALKM